MFNNSNWTNSTESIFPDANDDFDFGKEIDWDFDFNNEIDGVSIPHFENDNSNYSDETTNIQSNEQNNRSKNKKLKSGKYREAHKLEIYQHYKDNYKNKTIYQMLGCPKKNVIDEIGKEYNAYYRSYIKLKLLPKFKRSHSRLISLGVGFLQDNINIVIPFLRNKGYISS